MENLKTSEAVAAIEEVKYRRSKTWRIALGQMNSGASMCFYILMTYASYIGGLGYGIATAVIGVILTCTRIFDGITDPLIARFIDRFNSKYGKIRIMILLGWLIESIAVICLCIWASGKTSGVGGVVLFVVIYLVYVVGYTINNVAGQIINPVLSNDPKQRPTIGIWSTIYNYFIPIILNIVFAMVLLPKVGDPDGAGNFAINHDFLTSACLICVGTSFVLVVLACIGVTKLDKPETFAHIKAAKEKVSFKDMGRLIKNNKPLQCYIVAAASDKLAQQTASQTVVTIMLFGIMIGNYSMGTIMSVVAMIPSIVFAIFGARYVGKHGSKKATVVWTWICLGVAVIFTLFCAISGSNLQLIGKGYSALMGEGTLTAASVIMAMLFVILLLAMNGSKMCVTVASTSMCADITDYELYRSGRYLPAVVSGTYSFIDKMVSSLSSLIALGGIACIGYVNTQPQPTDALTTPIFIITLAMYFGLPVIGWVCTLFAMKKYSLDKDMMVEVQKTIAEQKAAAIAKAEAEALGVDVAVVESQAHATEEQEAPVAEETSSTETDGDKE